MKQLSQTYAMESENIKSDRLQSCCADSCKECNVKEFEFDSTYRRGDYSVIGKYEEGEVIYDELLSPSKVVIVKDESGKKFAKKIINKETLSDISKALARQECVIHSQMKHENIANLVYFAETPTTIELIIEYCDSHSYFEDRLEEASDPIEDAHLIKKYATETLRGLAYIHDKGIIHGDVKLANIALDRSNDSEGQVKIIDFGLSLVRDVEMDGKAIMSQAMGTLGYMAPEIKGTDIIVDTSIDMWAFGIALYKMCVAYAPTQIKGYTYGSGPVPFNRRDWKSIDPKMKDLISKCLEFHPEDRISAHDALQHEALKQ